MNILSQLRQFGKSAKPGLVLLGFVVAAFVLTLTLDWFAGDALTEWIGWAVYALGCTVIFIIFMRRRSPDPGTSDADMESAADVKGGSSDGPDPRDLQKARERIREHKQKGGSV